MRCTRLILVASFAALVLASQEASAKPVYLSCVAQGNGDTLQFKLAADEATGMVAISDQTGSQSMRATFSADEVTFGDHAIFDYWLNRIDLSISVRRWNGNIDKGKCQIAAARRRAF
jgi:hypothetical protein